jgi:hypothetical protein
MNTNMRLKKGEWIVLIFTLAYTLGFLVYYLSISNYEFLWYVAVLVFFFLLILLTLRKTGFDYIVLGGLSFWGLLHMAGGGIIVKDKVLYALELLPLWQIGDSVILKYDQVVHFFGFGVATLVVYHLLLPYLNDKANWKVLFPVIIAGGMGLGALNEIVEFIAVLSFPQTNVGGYVNTSLDLVFNALGAIAAVIFIQLVKYKKVL